MSLSPHKQSSVFLLFGILLMFATMVLHPVGGDFKHLVAVSQMGIIAHSIALFSLPFSTIGFIGLSKYLGANRFYSRLGLAFMLFGLVAAMLAAATNGLVLPFFINEYIEATPAVVDEIRPVLRYSRAFNHAFDYQLIAGMFLSAFFWSIAILQSENQQNWVAYLGFVVVSIVVGAMLAGFDFLGLGGFRVFVLGWLVWILAVAWMLWTAKAD